MRSSASRAPKSKSNRTNLKRALRRALVWSMMGCALVGGSACTRAKYRYRTNQEAYYLIDEKIAQSCENTAPYRIEVDPTSRMFDPFNPDRPPMPEDDPVSNRFMRMVDRKKGYPLWEANGRTNTAENPQWWSYLPLDERGVLVLDVNDAVRMALKHSPAYQQNQETLYLSALDVSSERFLFDSQFFGGWRGQYTNNGSARSTVSSQFDTGNGNNLAGRSLTMRKRYASGADLLVGFANSFTWQVAGPDDYSANSLLDFSLVQPLLRQGGRDVVLERLTLAERVLLANVRSFERYRRGFYLQVVTGRQAPQGPSRQGGQFGISDIQGLTGLAAGAGTVGGGGGNQGFTDTGTPGAGGYFGLLQQQLTIINTRENILRQQDNLMRLEDNYREQLLKVPESQTVIPQQQLQVAQQQQAVFSIQTNLLQTNVTYEAQLDTFKRLLGLPAYLCVEIRDPLLDQFNLISQELRTRRDELNTVRMDFGSTNTRILELSTVERDPKTMTQFRALENSNALQEQIAELRTTIQPLTDIEKQVLEQDMVVVRSDIERLKQAIPERKRQMQRLASIVETERDMVCSILPLKDFDARVLDSRGLEELPQQLTVELEKLEKKFTDYIARTEKLDGEIQKVAKEIEEEKSNEKRFKTLSEKAVIGTQDLVASIGEDILALQLIQARARTESALLPEVDLEPREALDIARANRRDWLNARAALVNRWRVIEVVADDLESVLDVTFSGDVRNTSDNPLALRSSTGRLRMGLAWDAPITRLQERNRYRQALIEYQQAKRNYYQFEDGVWQSLRTTLRSIRQNQLSFELQRYAVRNAAQQVSINEDIRQINETLGQAAGPTAARDTVSALGDLLNSQNLLIGVWVNYEALRRNLDLDLETMQIDSEGLWIDPGPIRADTVGGQLGPAILNYGLSEEEQAIAKKLEGLASVPTEFAPTNQIPSDAQHVYGPSELGLIEGPIVAQPNRIPATNYAPMQTETPAVQGSGLVDVSPGLSLFPEAPKGPLPIEPLNYPPLPPNTAGVPQAPVNR
ncbi:MAG: hypothetical protein SFV81_08790 [Pirellulaceae bacterium]|nr:hypothetical protein [Pirellulaceae bacterium]